MKGDPCLDCDGVAEADGWRPDEDRPRCPHCQWEHDAREKEHRERDESERLDGLHERWKEERHARR